jgi:hypothetical protein
MRKLFSGISSNIKHTIDFSLVPVAIIFIEFSVFITQLSAGSYGSLGNLILLRFIHTVAMIFVSTVVSRVYIWLKKPALSYRTLALTGVLVLAFGDLTHAYLASAFGIELISIYRRLGIIGLQGILWFPAFMIIASNRKEIVQQFKAYEQRLIVATRLRNRTSNEFKDVQRDTQQAIRSELHASCNALKDSIANITISEKNLPDANRTIQALLAGDELRKLSMKLDTEKDTPARRNFLGQSLQSLKLLIQQFRLLYASSVRLAPLNKKWYVLVLISLVTPPYINYYSFTELLFSYPILLISIILFANLVARTQSRYTSNSLVTASILIYVIGLLPLVANLAGQAIYHDPKTKFPILVTGLVLPLAYYICMEVLQILRPSALSLIQNDELEASSALQRKVAQVLSDEFKQNLSHKWAVFIHGKILTHLAATALKLETTATKGDLHTYKATVDALLSLLSAPDAEFEQKELDLESEISTRLNPWMGLLDINLQVDKELMTMRSARVQEIGEVIEELISNSVRHGKAKKMELRLIRSSQIDLMIVAIDNATNPPPENPQRSGLGTRIFNLASDGRWSITRVSTSTQFKLTMGLEV